MSYDHPNRQKYSFHFDAGNNGKVTMTVTDDSTSGIGEFFIIVDWSD